MSKESPIVLLVEDDMYIRDVMLQKLKQKGYTVLLALDGQEACDIIDDAQHAASIDLVLLDLLLPQLHGFDVLKKIKHNEHTKNIPVLILSNIGEREQINEGMELGAEAYLIKANYTPAEIVERLQHILKKDSK